MSGCQLDVGPDQVRFQVEPLSSGDTLLLRVVVLGPSAEKLWDNPVANSEDGFNKAVKEISAALALPPDAIEGQLAPHVHSARKSWLGEKKVGPADADDFLAGVLDSGAFLGAQYSREWLVKPLLVAGEPVIVGGPKKSMKSTFMADLAVSLGSGTSFLGQFATPRRLRCLVLNGESGEATVQETVKRILAVRGVQQEDLDVRWGFRLPRLGRQEDLRRLAEFVGKEEIKVVVIDPLYLCLIQGGADLSASNLFDMGPLLLEVSRSCLAAGATPVLVHHAKKHSLASRGVAGEPLELDDLAYSGFAEFARQWMLISRRRPYEPGSGSHQLWLSVGGSAGQGGLWGVNVEEGQLRENFGGRTYEVKVLNPEECRRTAQVAKEEKKVVRQQQQFDKDVKTIANVALQRRNGETMTRIAELSGLSKGRTGRAIQYLVEQHALEACEVHKGNGKGQMAHAGWKPTVRLASYAVGDGEPLPSSGQALVPGGQAGNAASPVMPGAAEPVPATPLDVPGDQDRPRPGRVIRPSP
jgi:replicative DNA helicase